MRPGKAPTANLTGFPGHIGYCRWWSWKAARFYRHPPC